MADQSVIVLPPLIGGQAESWSALLELSSSLGDNWLLVGGQMVFLHEVERNATDVRPTDDVDVVVDLRAEPTGLRRIHEALTTAWGCRELVRVLWPGVSREEATMAAGVDGCEYQVH